MIPSFRSNIIILMVIPAGTGCSSSFTLVSILQSCDSISSLHFSIISRVSELTPDFPFKANETVALDIPNCRAISTAFIFMNIVYL